MPLFRGGHLETIKVNPDTRLWSTVVAYVSQFSEKTHDKYAQALREWMNFLGSDPSEVGSAFVFANASFEQAIKFVEWQNQQAGLAGKRAEGTIKQNIDKIKRTYKILMDSGIIKKTPFALVKNLPVQKSVFRKKIVPFEKVFELINSPNTNTLSGLRDRAVLSLLFAGALRPVELTKLRISDFQVQNGNYYLFLEKTKNGQDYEQAIAKWSAEHVIEYLQELQKLAPECTSLLVCLGSRALFKPITTKTVRKIFKQYAEPLGLKSGYSAYSGRATAISKLIYDKVQLREVQLFSRHANLELLAIYDRRVRNLEESPAYNLSY